MSDKLMGRMNTARGGKIAEGPESERIRGEIEALANERNGKWGNWAGGELSADERREEAQAEARLERLVASYETARSEDYPRDSMPDFGNHEKTLSGGTGGGGIVVGRGIDGREIRALRASDRLAKSGGENLSVGKYLRGIVTGRWDGAEAEQRAMSIGTPTAGGHLVPTPLSNEIIDLARARSIAVQAGALVVPMDAQTLKFARQTADPVGYWKAENIAVTGSDLAFDSVTLTAKSLVALCPMSIELFEDSPNAGDVVTNALTKALGAELDRVVFVGSGAGQEPAGIYGGTDVNENIGLGADGAVPTDYDEWIDAIQDILAENGPDSGLAACMSPRTWATYQKMKDGEQRPLVAPQAVLDLRRLVSTSIPVDQTSGVSSDCSTIFVGDFSGVLIGLRTGIVLEATRFGAGADGGAFENLQIWVRAYLRADVQLARPKHMATILGVRA